MEQNSTNENLSNNNVFENVKSTVPNTMPNANPLMKHFRHPSIYLKLPSQGKYWPEGTIELGLTGELPIYSMTARDEITIRTPDALLNGESLIQVIHSCCPAIKDAWKMPSIDLDSILIAIRIASYGSDMDIDTICSNQECKHDNRHTIDLQAVLERVTPPNYDPPLIIDGLKIKLHPQNYFEANKTNLAAFEEERLLQVVNDNTMTEEVKLVQYKNHMEKLVDINLDLMVNGTEYIETSEGSRVTNRDHIKEFYNNADSKIMRAIRNKFSDFAKVAELPRTRVQCESCEAEYDVEVEFDYNRFFVDAS